jgi:methionyl-tRNA formyltransferase
MRIVFFGEDSFSAVVLNSLLDNNYTVLSVYSPLYVNNQYARLKNVCIDNKIEFKRVYDVNSETIESELKILNPDIICICHFEKIIKKNILKIPRLGCINLHPSILPYYRGLAPQHWPIINGDEETGITVHFVNEGIDTGDIIIQRKINIRADEYVSELQKRMLGIYNTIMVEALAHISDNKKFIKQNPSTGSYFGRLKVDNCHIDLDESIYKAYNLIRAVSYPYFGARIDDKIVWKAKIADNNLISELETLPKGFISDPLRGYFIKFKDGILELEKFNII